MKVKHIISYDSDDFDSAAEWRHMENAGAVYSILWDIAEELRQKIKYSDTPRTDLEEFQIFFSELLRERKIELE